MAVLQDIRNRAGLVLGVVGFALFAFVIGDALNSKTGIFGRTDRSIAKVNGEKIDYTEYEKRIKEMEDIYKMNSGSNSLDAQTIESIRDQVWQSIESEYVMAPEYKALGLAVSSGEMYDLFVGKHPHQFVQQLFGNPQTGQFNRDAVINFLKATEQDPKAKAYQLFLEGQIKAQLLNEKYNALLAKGMMVTSKQAELDLKYSKETKSIEFIVKPYSSISDSAVNVTKSDIKGYYEAHLKDYKQEDSRSAEYVVWDVKPLPEDYTAAEKFVADSKNDFSALKTDEEVASYLRLNSDTQWDGQWISPSDAPAANIEFAQSGEIGSVVGPITSSDTYSLIKLVNRAMLPDSASASHILVQEATKERAEKVADSLMSIVKANPSMFSLVARQNSKDKGSAEKGGELGWFKPGSMVKPFNDACFNGKKGEIVKVESQYGIHIINILDLAKSSQKVQLATFSRKVVPSTETYRKKFSEVSRFIGQNNSYDAFMKGITTEKLTKMSARMIRKNDKQVNDIKNSRDFVRWAFNNDVKSLSPIFEYGDKIVIAALTGETSGGYRSVEDVAGAIRATIAREKKAEKLMAEMKSKASSGNLSGAAQAMSLTVNKADDVSFSSYYITGAGVEPALIGAVAVSPTNKVTGPIEGNTGVYLFNVLSAQSAAGTPSVADMKRSMNQSVSYRVNYQAYSVLRDLADITDNRIKFQ